MGASPITNISMENARAASFALQRSRMTAIVITMPAQPPNACRKRQKISSGILLVNAQPNDAKI